MWNVPFYSLKGFFSNSSSPRIIWVTSQMYHFELIKCSSSLISHCWSLNWSYICLAWVKILNTWDDFSMYFNYDVMHATFSLPLIVCQLKISKGGFFLSIILMYNSIKPNIVQMYIWPVTAWSNLIFKKDRFCSHENIFKLDCIINKCILSECIPAWFVGHN